MVEIYAVSVTNVKKKLIFLVKTTNPCFRQKVFFVNGTKLEFFFVNADKYIL